MPLFAIFHWGPFASEVVLSRQVKWAGGGQPLDGVNLCSCAPTSPERTSLQFEML